MNTCSGISLYLQLEIKSWLVTGDSLSLELLNTERGNRSIALSRIQELQNTSAAQYKTVRAQSLSLFYCPYQNLCLNHSRIIFSVIDSISQSLSCLFAGIFIN